MISITGQEIEARWRDEQSEYLGLTVGMLYSKGVPVSLHGQALQEVLLACWASLKLELMPETGLPAFYQEDDAFRASLYNWFLLLVEAWASIHLGRAFPERSGAAFAVARELVLLVRNMPEEARATLRRNAGLAAVN